MKKILSAVLLIALLAVALVSCKEPEDPTTPPAPEARTTITAEEWAATCALVNYTCTQQATTVYVIDGVTTTPGFSAIGKSTATATYSKASEDGEPDVEIYEVFEDGFCYIVEIVAGSEPSVKKYEYENEPLSEALEFGDTSFEDLVYNAETKSYELSKTQYGADYHFSFYFENGVLVKLTLNASMVDGEDSLTMEIVATFSDIGTTTVEVPAFEKPAA